MNIKNNSAKIVALAALICIFSLADAFGQSSPEPNGEATLFGMNTLFAGQTWRLSVVNRMPLSDREIVPCLRVRIIADFYTQTCDGSVCPAPVRRVERTVTLDPGATISFNLGASRTGGERVSLSVFTSPVDESMPGYTRGTSAATLEVIESGRKLFNLPGVIKGFDPQPDPPQ